MSPVTSCGLVGEALGLRHPRAVLVDHAVAVPGQVGGGFAVAGGAIDIRADAARRLVRHQLAAILVLAHRDVGRGQVDQHRRAGQRRQRRGRHRRPQVLADLHEEGEQGLLLDLEQQPRAERDVALAAQVDRLAGGIVARGELAQLVELAVGRQIGLGRDAQDLAARDDGGTVVQQAVHLQRQRHHRDDRQVAGGLEHLAQRARGGVQQRLLVEQVLAGIGRQPQLRQHHEHGARLGRLRDQARWSARR